MNVCGYLVVRKPMENFHLAPNGVWPKQPPHIGSIYYGGVVRMPWCDIGFDLYDGKLPRDLKSLYQTKVLQGGNIDVCPVLDVAEQFLEYCNRERSKCELIAVYSQTLASMKGIVAGNGSSLEHRGWEPFQIGGGSLLDQGVFAAPEHFATWHKRLNANGLLESADDCLLYTSEYQRLVETKVLEELLPFQHYPVEPIDVLSV